MAMKEMYFSHFYCIFELFSTYPCMLMSFFSCFFGFLIRVLEVSPFAGTQSVLLIASHAQNVVLSRERKLR